MRRSVVLVLIALLATAMSAGAGTRPRVQPVLVPSSAVAGSPWRVVVSMSRPARATVEARGRPSTIRARLVRVRKTARYAATLRFPSAGTWNVSAVTSGRRTRLGAVAVDIRRDPLIADPLALAAEPDGSLIVGQRRQGALLRIASGRVSRISQDVKVFHVSTAGGTVYAVAEDGAVHRLDGGSLMRVTPPLDAGSAAVDGAGNVYVTVYAGWVKRIGVDGTVTNIAGDGTEGLAGDGGPATAAKLFHPHALAIGHDGALYVADTENRRIRRIDLATGVITTVGGDVGITTYLAVGPDGSIYSSDVARGSASGGVTRTTPAGVTTRILSRADISSVAVAPDGRVYVNAWEGKRILRLDPATGRTETVARG